MVPELLRLVPLQRPITPALRTIAHLSTPSQGYVQMKNEETKFRNKNQTKITSEMFIVRKFFTTFMPMVITVFDVFYFGSLETIKKMSNVKLYFDSTSNVMNRNDHNS